VKVALIIERTEAWRGGAETSTLEFSHRLAARGVEVHLVTSSRTTAPPDLRIHHVPIGAALKPLRTRFFIHRATEVLKRERFDLSHAVAPMPQADLYQPRGGLIRETLSRNVATRRHGPGRAMKRLALALNIKQRSLLGLERRICRPDGPVIVAVSRYVAAQLSKHYGLSGPRVRVVFNGVHVEPVSAETRHAERKEIREQYGLRPETLVLLCVAHNFRLKGVEALIDALALATQKDQLDVHALIVGRDNPVALIARSQRMGLTNRLTFTGPTQRIRAFFHAADVCVHPTYYDPCSRVVLEALSRGLPVITTRFNGAAEVMEDGVHGFVLDHPQQTERFAERLGRLRDPALRTTMGSSAAKLAPIVSMDRHVDEMLAVYEEILRSRPG
jgi:UDP-glucose:(heptosyl)LPS alpha-1,3-glucosyltransferase